MEILVQPGKTMARLVVADDGPGVPEEARRQVFDAFVKSPTAAGRSSHGLGLWIAREIVDSAGGSISIETTPGGGAMFVVELPLARDRRAT